MIFLELEASYATSCTLVVPELKPPRNNHSNMACPCGHAKVTVPQQLQILNQHHLRISPSQMGRVNIQHLLSSS